MLSEDAICRICYDPASEECPFVQPCLCNGTQQFVHEQCLLLYFSIRPAKAFACQCCLYTYNHAAARFFTWNRIFINMLSMLHDVLWTCAAYVPFWLLTRCAGCGVLPINLMFLVVTTSILSDEYSPCFYDKRMKRFYEKNTIIRIDNCDANKKLSLLEKIEPITWKIYECREYVAQFVGFFAPYGVLAMYSLVKSYF
uniref:RING-CH-type domain-containing protein n=1 Tax=Steinernema glaseri TaxID=37863 RepID=A0A1I7Z2F5_9BILA